MQDRGGVRLLLRHLPGGYKKLKRIWVDGRYSGRLVQNLRKILCRLALLCIRLGSDFNQTLIGNVLNLQLKWRQNGFFRGDYYIFAQPANACVYFR